MPETMDFPVFEAAPHVSGTQGKWALSASRPTGSGSEAPNGSSRSKLLLIGGGALLAILILGSVLVLTALTGDASDKSSGKPSPAAATPTSAPTPASPSPSPSPTRPSASAAGGEYEEPYYPPPPKKTTEAPTEDPGDWDDEWPPDDWDDDDWWDGESR